MTCAANTTAPSVTRSALRLKAMEAETPAEAKRLMRYDRLHERTIAPYVRGEDQLDD